MRRFLDLGNNVRVHYTQRRALIPGEIEGGGKLYGDGIGIRAGLGSKGARDPSLSSQLVGPSEETQGHSPAQGEPALLSLHCFHGFGANSFSFDAVKDVLPSKILRLACDSHSGEWEKGD